MTDLPTRLRDAANGFGTLKSPLGDYGLCDEAAAEIERLRDILLGIEMLTATGEGLDAEQTIMIHLIAAEGRADDPCAWRVHPAVIERLRAAVRVEEPRNDQ